MPTKSKQVLFPRYKQQESIFYINNLKTGNGIDFTFFAFVYEYKLGALKFDVMV